MEYDLLIKDATTVNSQGQKRLDVAIKDGKISCVAELISSSSQEVIWAKGKHLLPGVIDSQVHFREPGNTHKEDFASGGQAAAMGGITTIFDMPNTNPGTTSVARLKEKLSLAQEKCPVNFGLYAGATADNLDELMKCVRMGVCPGVKIFLGSSTGDLLLYDEQKLLRILENIKTPIAIHSESEMRLRERLPIRDSANSAHAHPLWRDEETALASTKMIIHLCKRVGRKVHILHVSTAQEMEFLKEHKEFCTVEVTPQHLTLESPDCYDRLDTYAQMNPPIRSSEHRQALWQGITDGTVDVIGSDHAPHTREEKDQGYPRTPSGMPGTQTLLPLMLGAVNQGKLSLERLVELVCERPAEIFQLKNKGKIAEGLDGDLTLVDMEKNHTITHGEQLSRCGWTPFDGMAIKGMPVATIVGGNILMRDNQLTKEYAGRPIA